MDEGEDVADGFGAAYGSLNADDVAELDRAAVESGVSVLQLMEIAGWQVARCAWGLLNEQPGTVLVLAGRGNNGGDAMVAARHLTTWHCSVRACVVADEMNLGELLAAQVRAAQGAGVSVTLAPDGAAAISALDEAAQIVLDGLLGTGLHSAPREPIAGIIRSLNTAQRSVLAIDVPSGLDASTGDPYDPCVRATWTCTLAAMKHGLWLDVWRRGAAHTGDVWVADIGMPAVAWRAIGLPQPGNVRGGVLVKTASGS